MPSDEPQSQNPAYRPNGPSAYPGQPNYGQGYGMQPPLRVEVLPSGGRVWKWLFFGLLAFLAFMFFMMIVSAIASIGNLNPNSKVNEQSFVYVDDKSQQAKQQLSKSRIAIITVDGVITHQDDGYAKHQIDAVRNDDDVVGMVLRVDSPGGTVTGSHYIWHHLKKLREEKKIPLVVSMGGITASGGYYISMAVGNEEDVIFAEETTWTGSIGVIIPHYDIADLLKQWDIKDDSIMSNPLKAAGSMTQHMTDAERKLFQDLVDESFADFKNIVKQGRPKMDQASIDAAATGQIFTAKQALNRGLVDKLGFLEDAVAHAVKLAGKTPDEVKAVRYKKPETLFGELGPLGQSQGRVAGPTDAALNQLRTLTTPRAYFLWPAALPAAKE
ncbi:MAG: signal peptide peptidase SppA [Pirellulales bacterium]